MSVKKYTLGEELVSSISHGIGALIGIIQLIYGIVIAYQQDDMWNVVSMAIYGTSLIVLFLMSTLYHALTHPGAKAVFRVLDHNSIFLLIAGTYTPYTIGVLRETHPVLAWTLFAIIWLSAVVGIVFNSISVDKFWKVSLAGYLVMGWAALLAIGPLISTLIPISTALLFGGGIVYSLGAIVYVLGRKTKYFHSIWHFFVLSGSILHYLSIILQISG